MRASRYSKIKRPPRPSKARATANERTNKGKPATSIIAAAGDPFKIYERKFTIHERLHGRTERGYAPV